MTIESFGDSALINPLPPRFIRRHQIIKRAPQRGSKASIGGYRTGLPPSFNLTEIAGWNARLDGQRATRQAAVFAPDPNRMLAGQEPIYQSTGQTIGPNGFDPARLLVGPKLGD